MIGLLAASSLALATWVTWQITRPLPLTAASIELSIEPGTTPRAIARNWVEAGVQVEPWLLYQWFRWSGRSSSIRAGNYELTQGMSARDLLRMMVRGDERLSTVRLIEGWTFRRFREELAQAEGLQPQTAAMSDEAIMQALGLPDVPPEGRFFPDTYAYAKGSADLAVMRRALHAMQRQLDAAWAQRRPDTPLKSPEDALVLASIVEKETAKAEERPIVAAVYRNRVRVKMGLQADPTVVYALRKANMQKQKPRYKQP